MIIKNAHLKSFNTFGFNVNSDLFVHITSAEQLRSIWKTNLIPRNHSLILGGGSNILFTGNYKGLILKNELKGRETVREDDHFVWVKTGSGENWHQTVLWAVGKNYGGIENLSYIPGTVGAAPIQNIGAYGVEVKSVIEEVEVFDLLHGTFDTIKNSDCHFGYRDSIFKNEAKGRYYITSVVLKLSKFPEIHTSYGDIVAMLEEKGIHTPGIKEISEIVTEIRKRKLPEPGEIGNCGSFFKNPVISKQKFDKLKELHPDIKSYPADETSVKIPAAWLIERAGWKGYRKGDAGVHNRQALVLVNYGNATGKEIKELAFEVQKDIASKFGITLELEVNIR